MTWKEVLFTFQGRIPRQTFWIWWLATFFMMFVAGFVIGLIFHNDAGTLSPIGMVLMLPFYVFSIWSGLALQIKRWHDRGKSGWWVLITLIPLVGGIWALVECGFLRGTVGPNQFGEDPTV